MSSFFDDFTEDGTTCYAEDANADRVRTFNSVPDIGGGPLKNCQMHCRSEGLQSTLQSSSDKSSCICSNKALSAKKDGCDDINELKHFSNGIGVPPVLFNEWPKDLQAEGSDFNTDIIDSQFVKVSFI